MSEVNVALLEFVGKKYCIDIEFVKEIVTEKQIFPVPLTPNYLMGVINLRGEVVPLFDLVKLLGLESTSSIIIYPLILVLDVGGKKFGVGLEKMVKSQVFHQTQIKGVREFSTFLHARFFKGVIENVLDNGEVELIFYIDMHKVVEFIGVENRKRVGF